MQEIVNYTYTEGNLARRQQVYTRPMSERMQRIREQEAIHARNNAVYRKRVAEARRSKAITFYFVLIFGVFCSLFVGYVSLQSSISASMKNIAKLEVQINEMKADNNAASSRIATITNLNEIKETAIEDYGMIYADSSQIVYYSMDQKDFMSQYADIP